MLYIIIIIIIMCDPSVSRCSLHMSDLCVGMRDVVSEFVLSSTGLHASCGLMLFLCSISCLMCSGSSLHVECVLSFVI